MELSEYEYAKRVEDGWLLYQGKTLKGKLTFTRYDNNYQTKEEIESNKEELAKSKERVKKALGLAVKPKEVDKEEEKTKEPLTDTRVKYAPLGDCKEDRMEVALKFGLVRNNNNAYELTEKCRSNYQEDSFMKYLHGEIEKAERVDKERNGEILNLLSL